MRDFIIFLTITTACNLSQQRKDAIEARHKSDSILNEFNKINQSIKQEDLKVVERNEKLLDSFHHLLDSLNSQSR